MGMMTREIINASDSFLGTECAKHNFLPLFGVLIPEAGYDRVDPRTVEQAIVAT